MNATHLIITNRAGSITKDGWLHIVPKGELPNQEAGLVQVLDDTALDTILSNITAEQQRLGDRWPGIYGGREHFIYNDDQDSVALAWFKRFEKRSDGIWAHEDGLTDLGRDALKNSRYKFTSFVASRRDTEPLGTNRVRILKIDTIGFTNQANGKELLTPLVNRETFADAGASADNNSQTTKGINMQRIAEALGLSAEATEEQILAAIAKLKEKPAEASAEAQTEMETMSNRIQQLEGEQVDGLLEQHGITDETRIKRLRPVLLTMKNREDRSGFLKDVVKVEDSAPAAGSGRVLNRSAAQTPQAKDQKSDHDRMTEISSTVGTIRNRDKCSYDEAFARARREKPELFS